MALFYYKAFSLQGRQVKDFVSADSLIEARDILTKKSFVIIELKEAKRAQIKSRLTVKEILFFTQDLSKLLSASLPLYESLVALEEKYRTSKNLHPIILDLCDKVKEGKSLSKALVDHSSFDILYRSMVANAEKTGSLDSTFNELTDLLSKQENLKKRLFSLLLYPAILSAFCLVVINVLLFVILPSLFELFEERNNLHPLTCFILGLSKMVNGHKMAILIGALTVTGFIIFCVISPKIRKEAYKLVLHIPFINHIIMKASIMRFCLSFFLPR